MYTHFRAPAARSIVLMIGERLRTLPTRVKVELDIRPAEEIFNGFDPTKYVMVHVNADDMRPQGMDWTTRLADVIRQKRCAYVVYNAKPIEQRELQGVPVHFACFLDQSTKLYDELLNNK